MLLKNGETANSLSDADAKVPLVNTYCTFWLEGKTLKAEAIHLKMFLSLSFNFELFRVLSLLTM